jgi:hypothetical protein
VPEAVKPPSAFGVTNNVPAVRVTVAIGVFAVTCAVVVSTFEVSDTEVAGAETRTTVAVSADDVSEANPFIVIVFVAAVPTTPALAAAPNEIESAVGAAAFAETAENPPRVSATAATAAMRLKLVFVDIIFLSEKVDLKNFFISAWPLNTDS